MNRLKLRKEGRSVPYYTVVKQHFSERELEKLVDPDHTCACNVCGKSLEDIKQKAAQDAVAEY